MPAVLNGDQEAAHQEVTVDPGSLATHPGSFGTLRVEQNPFSGRQNLCSTPHGALATHLGA